MKKLMFGLAGMISMTAMAASFSYQGVLRGATGEAVAEKNQVITFRLYDGPTTETPLWGRTSSVLLDENGLFNVELGDATGSAVKGLTNSLDRIIAENAGAALYIGLEVRDSAGEIRPRQKVLSVPLASYAMDVGAAKRDFTVAGAAKIAGSLVADGETKLNGLTTVNKLSVENGATLAGGLNVTGPLNLSSGQLEMPASATFTIGGISAVIPSGVVVMWSGSKFNIPTGWALCDGTNGTPDLRDRFVVGAGLNYGVGETGGANEVKLDVKHIPPHNHRFMGDDDLAAHGWGGDTAHERFGDYDATSRGNGESRMYSTTLTGGGTAHENRPPYYALCYIMKK